VVQGGVAAQGFADVRGPDLAVGPAEEEAAGNAVADGETRHLVARRECLAGAAGRGDDGLPVPPGEG
jgi:hypothetical protein